MCRELFCKITDLKDLFGIKILLSENIVKHNNVGIYFHIKKNEILSSFITDLVTFLVKKL